MIASALFSNNTTTRADPKRPGSARTSRTGVGASPARRDWIKSVSLNNLMNDQPSDTKAEQPRYLLPGGCSNLIDVLRLDAELWDKVEEPEDIIDFRRS